MQQSLFPPGNFPGLPIANQQSRSRPLINRQELNEPQYQAVTSTDGPLLVIAGAGSGKTRTLVYRVAHLIDRGVAPENILLLTFTRKAAQEMLRRASQLLDQSCQRVMGGTFHAVANLLLRRYGSELGYGPGFTILDRNDAEGIVNILKASLSLSSAGKRFPSKRIVTDLISKSINKSLPLEDLLLDEYQHLEEFLSDIVLLRDHYNVFKFEHGLMDYDDLLVNWKKVLQQNPAVRQEMSNRFSHIMVDEYQDTNQIQADIVRLIAQDHTNVMVVGDDSQSIYSFRGANFRNIMDFPRLFTGTRIIKLEENYRSTQPILSLTNAIISCAEEKYSKSLFTSIAAGDKPLLYQARDEAAEARFIVEKIKKLHRDGLALREIAVLFRSGFHSYKLEIELNAEQFAFEKRGGLKLTESAHIKDSLAFFKILVNPQDYLAWNRMLLMLDKVGPKTAQKILERIKSAPEPLQALAQYPAAPAWKAPLAGLTKLLAAIGGASEPPGQLFDQVLDFYRPIFERLYPDDFPKRSRDLEQIRDIAAGYDSLQAFIDDTTLDPPETGLDPFSGDSNDRLVLSTIHSAKGLEWDTVFIISLAEGKFPVSSHLPAPAMEEERRLLYVAATRAKRRLFMTYPREVMSPDRKYTRASLSPFVAEIEHGHYLLAGETAAPPMGYAPPLASRRPPPLRTGNANPKAIHDTLLLENGSTVKHPFFGEGVVENISGTHTVEVYFPGHGSKRLHLDYAKLETT